MYVIETMMPDGPHWYGGIRFKSKSGQTIAGGEWTPYYADAKLYSTKAEAKRIHKKVLQKTEGVQIVKSNLSTYAFDSRWEHDGCYFMRAKYATAGLLISFKDVDGVFQVEKLTPDEIFLKHEGKTFSISRATETWVKIEGKREVAHELH